MMFKQLSILVVILCAFMIGSASLYAIDADSVLGVWKVESKKDDATQITIYKCDAKYCGKISWLEKAETLDEKNPDESLQSRKLLGMDMIFDFEFDDDHWEEGKIYDARSGKTYSCKMWYEDETQTILNVKGFVGISLFGKTSVWYRFK
jgi:uncharacterized protein (DUF2147 family)